MTLPSTGGTPVGRLWISVYFVVVAFAVLFRWNHHKGPCFQLGFDRRTGEIAWKKEHAGRPLPDLPGRDGGQHWRWGPGDSTEVLRTFVKRDQKDALPCRRVGPPLLREHVPGNRISPSCWPPGRARQRDENPFLSRSSK